ncbi:MAG: tRNA (cytidine(34)-2'-O)-methyltransferase [Acidimicrobiales bacterium]
MHVVLVHPEIAPNTGAIIRLCANTGARLHLVEPLGFELSDTQLKRGGLDYHEHADMTVHPDVDTALAGLPGRRFGFSSRGTRRYTDVDFTPDDVLIFGAERAGLDDHAISLIPADQMLVIPMRPDNRSINLANAVSIVLYEAWRQRDFAGAGETGTGTVERLHLGPFDS